jgi:hypothetical protein
MTWMDPVNHKDLSLNGQSSDRYFELGPPKKETVLLSIRLGNSVNSE